MKLALVFKTQNQIIFSGFSGKLVCVLVDPLRQSEKGSKDKVFLLSLSKSKGAYAFSFLLLTLRYICLIYK